MEEARQLPLGTVLPAFPHGTVVSLPTLADVDGYERREAAVWSRIRAGYPRFVLNELVALARDRAATQAGLDPARSLPLHSPRAARQAVALAAPTTSRIHDLGAWALLEVDRDSLERVAKLVQHAGLRLASRAAEDWLAGRQTRSGPVDALAAALAPWVRPAGPADLRVTPSGMNALAAAVEGARAVQRPQGRGAWLQLGWLYVDTAEFLRKTLAPGETLTVIDDVADRTAIERFFDEHRGKVAGVVAELPTNPRLASPDLAHLSALAGREGALRILDPSSSGLVNVDLMPHADLLVASLTKYAASRGDVMAGLLVVHPSAPCADELRRAAFGWAGPAAGGDVQALLEQFPEMESVARAQNRAARVVADHLARHPAVARVLTADRGPTAAAYDLVARGPGRPGALITFELKGEMRAFYDAVALPKGPSFGLRFSLLCPFLWLSHHDLVTSEAGRKRIREAGLNPDLIRLSVGAEPAEGLIARLDAALGRSASA